MSGLKDVIDALELLRSVSINHTPSRIHCPFPLSACYRARLYDPSHLAVTSSASLTSLSGASVYLILCHAMPAGRE